MASSQSGGDSNRGRFRRKRNGHGSWRSEAEKEKQPRDGTVNANINSPMLEAFKGFQVELDSRNDCYERIVKLSRDITIESKRIIFLLHRVTGSEDRNSILAYANAKLLELRTTKFIPLAKELDGKDPYQFLRAFSPGLQEYIEAVTFNHYLANNQLLGLDIIQAELTFLIHNPSDSQPADTRCPSTGKMASKKWTDTSVENKDASLSDKTLRVEGEQDALIEHSVSQPSFEKSSSSAETSGVAPTLVECVNQQKVSVPVPPTEYIMGVADFTGELMKMAINSVGSGDLKTPTVVADMMRVMHDAYASFGNIRRDLRQKIKVLRQSLQKVETACYAMKVRGSEMPTHMLIDVFTTASSGTNEQFNMDDPEEFYD